MISECVRYTPDKWNGVHSQSQEISVWMHRNTGHRLFFFDENRNIWKSTFRVVVWLTREESNIDTEWYPDLLCMPNSNKIKRIVSKNIPSGHMTSIQRRLNDDATSWRCIDVETTLYRRHVSAGYPRLFLRQPSFSMWHAKSLESLKMYITETFFNNYIVHFFSCRPRWLSWIRRPIGDQEVAGSTPAEVGNILAWRLIMKYFLRSFSPFRWFKKGSCQFLAKECAQY